MATHSNQPSGEFASPLKEIGKRTLIMGIINVTPDSFSGDGLGDDVESAVRRARQMKQEGADILDIGGQSTRPGSQAIDVVEELRRVIPVVERLASDSEIGLPLSVDTNRAAVADAAVRAGATIINDISGLRDDPEIADVAAAHGARLVLMHIQGTPSTMQQHPHYEDLLGEVIAYLRQGVDKSIAAGVPQDRIWVDPGIGFGKTLQHNLELIRRLGELKVLGCPILIGTSRKGFIGKLLAPLHNGRAPAPAERIAGTGATIALSIVHGADIVRVHDVAQAADVARVTDAVVRGYVE
ncbi:MAG: dihydropteroate synthase [Chloroflexota bacterium]